MHVAYFSKCGVLVCCFPQCKPCREAKNKTAHRHGLRPLYFSQPHIKLLHCSIYSKLKKCKSAYFQNRLVSELSEQLVEVTLIKNTCCEHTRLSHFMKDRNKYFRVQIFIDHIIIICYIIN